MKKCFIYSMILVAVLFAGCSQKSFELGDDVSQNKTSDSEKSLEKISESNVDVQSFAKDENEDSMNGDYVDIAGKKVFINNIYFEFDKYNLDDKSREIAKKNSVKLSGLEENTKIKLEANCDEWGTDEYNYALGLKRGKTVKDALIEDGIAPSSISIFSFGESNPVCTDKNIACWKKNRRVEYKLLP